MRKPGTMLIAAAAGLMTLLGITGVHLAVDANRTPKATQAAAATVSLKVVTWNICGDFSGCPKTATAAETIGKRDAIKKLIDDKQAGAIILNETCEWYASTVLEQLNAAVGWKLWYMSFSGARQYDEGSSTRTAWLGRHTRTCAGGRWNSIIEPDATGQALGTAILTKGPHDQVAAYQLTSPQDDYSLTAPLLCVRKIYKVDEPGETVRVCASHFTPPGGDPVVNGVAPLRTAQGREVADILASYGNERIVFGGDLNTFAPDVAAQPNQPLVPVYNLMRECTMDADNLRDGPHTTDWTGGSGKLDYLFARSNGGNPASLVTSCETGAYDSTQPWSDHAWIVGSFVL
ncbi:endonuclease/exonuclease/phosphatase family protein [Actinoplanes sp. NPDC051494]|uniref:endonuclease/exonuclease/phosphatase family protein n=1 Tax=Actinoplanes sp. NPDC051494 TaxID=3363907 RepID=UPI0037A4033D